MKRIQLLEAVATEWAGCRKCPLHEGRTRMVHWRGNPSARLALIGEAPGKDEDRRGLPFVGASGQLLDAALERAGLSSSEDVFIVNTVACRPPGNRMPERSEVRACSPRLQSLLASVRPSVLLLLGAVAARLAGINGVKAFLGASLSVEFIESEAIYPARVTFHPSYVIRTGGKGSDSYYQLVSDIRKAHRMTIG